MRKDILIVFSKVSIGLLIYLSVKLYILYIYSYTSIVYFDVGQGDASLFSHRSGLEIVIDGGPNSSFIQQLQKRVLVDNPIEYLVLTHSHEDHILGLIEIVRRYRVFTLILPTSCINSSLYEYLVAQNTAEKVIFTDFVHFKIDSKGVTSMEYNKKSVSKCYTGQKAVNNSSVVVQIDYKGSVFLFMGDSEASRELSMLEANLLPEDISVLKAGHHCSDTSSSEVFLKRASPDLIICSYGKGNEYGHPGRMTLKRFEKMGAKHMDTAVNGDIVINLD